jgi:hypothetical protein
MTLIAETFQDHKGDALKIQVTYRGKVYEEVGRKRDFGAQTEGMGIMSQIERAICAPDEVENDNWDSTLEDVFEKLENALSECVGLLGVEE